MKKLKKDKTVEEHSLKKISLFKGIEQLVKKVVHKFFLNSKKNTLSFNLDYL